MKAEEIDKYPQCDKCSNYLSIRIIKKEIQLYCLQCSYYVNYPVDDQLLSKILAKKNPEVPKYLETVECEYCKQTYCSSCYLYHQDVLTSITLNTDMEPFYLTLGEPIEQKYSTYNTRCDKCKRNNNSNLILLKNNSSGLHIIKRNVQKAENYYNNYFCKIKNDIIAELQQKINSIEEAFKVNYDYHKNIFSLIRSLIKFAYLNSNNTIIKSLNDLSNFSFPKLEISDKERLDNKITKTLNFFQNEYIISEQSLELNKISKSLDVVEFKVLGTPLKLSHNIVLLRGKDLIIYDGFDFHQIIKLKFKKYTYITAVCEIDENKWLLGQYTINKDPSIMLFEIYDRKYKLKVIKTLKEDKDNNRIKNIYTIINNKQIIVLLSTKIEILEYDFPYKIIKSMKIPLLFYSIQLKDQRILASVDIDEDRDYHFFHLMFWNTMTGDIKEDVIDAEIPSNEIFEINNQKLILEMASGLMIYNMKTYQVESTIYFSLNTPRSVDPKLFYINHMITFVHKHIISCFNEITLQKVFEISIANEKKESLLNIFSLSNGITLLVFDNTRCANEYGEDEYSEDKYDGELCEEMLEKRLRIREYSP